MPGIVFVVSTVIVTVSPCTGINEILENAVSVYPNPANGVINIDLTSELTKNSSLEVYDALGKLVVKQVLANELNSINISTLSNGIYTFIWDGQMQQARLLKTIDVLLVRFQWVDKNDGSYFEFRIQRDDLTNDISLIITDFADSNSERESAKLLWHSQVEKLMHVIGSIF